MLKSTQGALAASAAGALLLGGAGSLAFWTATDTVDGGSATAGTLVLDGGACDPSWVYAPGNASAGDPVVLYVPGDVITKQCTFDVEATGDNLSAVIDAPDTVAISSDDTDPLSTFDASVGATYAIDGTNARTLVDGDDIDSVDNGSTLTVTFVVTFPYGDATTVNANDTQGTTASLDDLTVTLTQNNPN